MTTDINLDKTTEPTVDLDKHTPTPAWAQVAVLGGDVTDIDFKEGMTISQALEQADVTIENGQVVTVNGRRVTDFEQPLEAGSAVMVVTKVSNG